MKAFILQKFRDSKGRRLKFKSSWLKPVLRSWSIRGEPPSFFTVAHVILSFSWFLTQNRERSKVAWAQITAFWGSQHISLTLFKSRKNNQPVSRAKTEKGTCKSCTLTCCHYFTKIDEQFSAKRGAVNTYLVLKETYIRRSTPCCLPRLNLTTFCNYPAYDLTMDAETHLKCYTL